MQMSAIPKGKINHFVLEIGRLINSSDKRQTEMAEQLGYDNANVVAMIKRGNMKMPLERLGDFARVLDADPGDLLRLWFTTYEPEILKELERNAAIFLSKGEREILMGIREDYGTKIPSYKTFAKLAKTP